MCTIKRLANLLKAVLIKEEKFYPTSELLAGLLSPGCMINFRTHLITICMFQTNLTHFIPEALSVSCLAWL